jgi:hypothetical protein
MKKVTTALLVTALAFSVTGQVSAQDIKQPAPIVQNVDVSNLWMQIDSFSANLSLKDETYKVTYDNNDGIVNVKIKKKTGKEEFNVTGQEANKRVIEFVKSLDLSKNLSKEEVINRLSTALGIEPSEVQKADAKLTFTSNAKVSFSYKQGEKSGIINPFELSKLKVQIKEKNGISYNIHLFLKDKGFEALVQKKTEDGKKVLKGSDALQEIFRIKNGLVPTNDTTLNGYLTKVSDVLGVEVTDITKANVNVQFANNTKIDLNLVR